MNLRHVTTTGERIGLSRMSDRQTFRGWVESISYKAIEVVCPQAPGINLTDTFLISLRGEEHNPLLGVVTSIDVDVITLQYYAHPENTRLSPVDRGPY